MKNYFLQIKSEVPKNKIKDKNNKNLCNNIR